MNKEILAVGAFLLCLSGLFPPWRSPPRSEFLVNDFKTEDYHFILASNRGEIDAGRLIAQSLIIGGVFLFLGIVIPPPLVRSETKQPKS